MVFLAEPLSLETLAKCNREMNKDYLLNILWLKVQINEGANALLLGEGGAF